MCQPPAASHSRLPRRRPRLQLRGVRAVQDRLGRGLQLRREELSEATLDKVFETRH